MWNRKLWKPKYTPCFNNLVLFSIWCHQSHTLLLFFFSYFYSVLNFNHITCCFKELYKLVWLNIQPSNWGLQNLSCSSWVVCLTLGWICCEIHSWEEWSIVLTHTWIFQTCAFCKAYAVIELFTLIMWWSINHLISSLWLLLKLLIHMEAVRLYLVFDKTA